MKVFESYINHVYSFDSAEGGIFVLSASQSSLVVFFQGSVVSKSSEAE